MDILWHSNAPWVATGYGVQTGLMAPLVNQKHRVTISAFYGLEGNQLDFNGITVLPGEQGTYGNEYVRAHASKAFGGDIRGGLVLSLMDVWVLATDVWKMMRSAAWVPVDHEPVPPLVRQYFVESGAVPIAMSRFGQEQLGDLDALYAPHGVDTSKDAFHPVPRDEARRRSNLPRDAFVVGVVAANKGNPSRKCFPEIIRAFKIFREHHDDAVLYMHTELNSKAGVPLNQIFEHLGMDPAYVYATDQMRYLYNPLPPRQMASMFSAFDVLVNTAAGEGFGIPILEAAACGTPAIVTDFSAMPEVAGVGWRVQGRPSWTGQGAYQSIPIIEEIVDALEKAYAMPRAAMKELRADARRHAEGYDAQKVAAEHLIPALEEAGKRLGVPDDALKVVSA